MRKLNMMDGQTDRQRDGGVAISPVPGPTAPAGDNNSSKNLGKQLVSFRTADMLSSGK